MSINKLDLGNVLTIVVMVVLHFWDDLSMNGIDLSFLPLLFGAVALIGVIVSILIKGKTIKTLEFEKAESQSNATRLQEECDQTNEKQKYLRRLFHLFVRKFDPYINLGDEIIDSSVGNLIDAGFPPASFDMPADIVDSYNALDAHGYIDGVKKLQDKYG